MEYPEAVSISDEKAVIRWRSDVRSTGQVTWRQSGAKEDRNMASHSRLSPDGRLLEHFIILTQLDPSETYEYFITSGDYTLPINYYFTTSEFTDSEPPSISLQPLCFTAGSKAIIWWETNDYSDSQVEFGQFSGVYANIETSIARGEEHCVILKELIPGNTYWGTAFSRDISGNTAVSSEFNFTAQEDATNPQFTIYPEILCNDYGYLYLTWQSDEPCIAKIEYGLNEYVASTFVPEFSLEPRAYVLDCISGLEHDFQVTLQDLSGNVTNYEFSATAPEGCASPTPIPTPFPLVLPTTNIVGLVFLLIGLGSIMYSRK